MAAHPILTFLLASHGAQWGPVLDSVTVVDVLLVLLVAAAAVRGWHLGISRVALGVGGLVAGFWGGLWVAVHLVPGGLSPAVTLALQIATVLAGALVGSAIGNAVGVAVGRLLSAMHLRLPDRAAGSVGRAALALVVCWTVVTSVAAFAPGQAGASTRTIAGVTRCSPSPPTRPPRWTSCVSESAVTCPCPPPSPPRRRLQRPDPR